MNASGHGIWVELNDLAEVGESQEAYVFYGHGHDPASFALPVMDQTYLVTPDGTFQIRDSQDAEYVTLTLLECYVDPIGEPLQVLSRQQIATRLGHGLPEEFPVEDVVAGDVNQAKTRFWFEWTLQRYRDRQS